MVHHRRHHSQLQLLVHLPAEEREPARLDRTNGSCSSAMDRTPCLPRAAPRILRPHHLRRRHLQSCFPPLLLPLPLLEVASQCPDCSARTCPRGCRRAQGRTRRPWTPQLAFPASPPEPPGAPPPHPRERSSAAGRSPASAPKAARETPSRRSHPQAPPRKATRASSRRNGCNSHPHSHLHSNLIRPRTVLRARKTGASSRPSPRA
mmetsp:Transcript_3796/g.9588  ORF Transcript_3796/g.9588 Transcript_3796/m.9588 type:complete len:206 (+) Transcript_3796:609-1226(+)